jgi:hypothetical protein
LSGHHDSIAFALGGFVFSLYDVFEFYSAFNNSVFVGDLKFGKSISGIDWNGVMNLKRFGERIGVFLDGLNFSKLVFDFHLIFVGNDGKQTFLIVLDKEVAEGSQ